MRKDHNYYVYIVECADGAYYTGVTNNVNRRLGEHNEGVSAKSFTYNRRPVVLKYSMRFNKIEEAITFEKQVKGWSRKKKEALFEEDWEQIGLLAKSRQNRSSSTG